MAEPELLGVYFDPDGEYPWRVVEIAAEITVRRVDNPLPFFAEWKVPYETFEGSWCEATWDPSRQLWMIVTDDLEDPT